MSRTSGGESESESEFPFIDVDDDSSDETRAPGAWAAHMDALCAADDLDDRVSASSAVGPPVATSSAVGAPVATRSAVGPIADPLAAQRSIAKAVEEIMVEDSDDEPSTWREPMFNPDEVRAAKFGMPLHLMLRMIALGVPIVALNVCWWFTNNSELVVGEFFDYLHAFEGVGACRWAAERRGLSAVGYDIANSSGENILSNAGMVYLLYLCRCCASWVGPVLMWCSSCIWLCRAKSKRSVYEPLGPPNPPKKVYRSNVMAARVAICLLILFAQECNWIIEQQNSSLLMLHPRLLQIQFLVPALMHLQTTWMGSFGGLVPKLTKLYSASDVVVPVKRKMTQK